MMSRKLWCLAAISTSPSGGVPRTSQRRPVIQPSVQNTQRQNAWQAACAPAGDSTAQGKYTIAITSMATYICPMNRRDRSHWII